MKAMGSFTKLAVFLAAYTAACLWSSKWATGTGAALWPPDAVLLIALLFEPPERWWWYLLGAVPVRWLVLSPTPQWFFWSCTSMIRSRRCCRRRSSAACCPTHRG